MISTKLDIALIVHSICEFVFSQKALYKRRLEYKKMKAKQKIPSVTPSLEAIYICTNRLVFLQHKITIQNVA